MKFEQDNVIFESTGRKEYTFGNLFIPDEPNGVFYGWDGGFGGLVDEEKEEIATYMIEQWKLWLRREVDHSLV